LLVKQGVLVHIHPAADESRGAWASVESCDLAGDVKILNLQNLRFEGESKARAARCEIELSVSAAFTDGREQLTKRTIGQTVNISVSGLRARFRSTVPHGISVHVSIHLEADKIVDAVARVVRIVPGSESASGGYEVGLEFQRFIRGYNFLLEAMPVGTEALDEVNPGDEEWVA